MLIIPFLLEIASRLGQYYWNLCIFTIALYNLFFRSIYANKSYRLGQPFINRFMPISPTALDNLFETRCSHEKNAIKPFIILIQTPMKLLYRENQNNNILLLRAQQWRIYTKTSTQVELISVYANQQRKQCL